MDSRCVALQSAAVRSIGSILSPLTCPCKLDHPEVCDGRVAHGHIDQREECQGQTIQ